MKFYCFPFLLLTLSLSSCKLFYNVQEKHTATQSESQQQIILSSQGDTVGENEQALSDVAVEEFKDIHANVDLWQAIRNEMSIVKPYLDKEHLPRRIQREIDWLLKHPHHIRSLSKQAEPYLAYIFAEVKAQNLPAEIALLPMIESAYNPYAYSSSGAAGLWQFMPATATGLGLKQDWWRDDRLDIVGSTQAAITHLQYLNKRLDGDWPLTLSAYNAGLWTVFKAQNKNQKKNKAVDYWSLDLPAETQRYTPRLLAISYMIFHADRYAINLHSIEKTPAFEPVAIDSQIDLAQASDLAGVDLQTLYQFNPQFIRWATSPQESVTLLVPKENADLFQEKLTQLNSQDLMQWRRHTVVAGDTLSAIVRHSSITAKQLSQINQLKSDVIRIGQVLMVPVEGQENPNYLTQNRYRSNQIIKRYRVKQGDSWWRIARKFSVKLDSLVRWNKKTSRDILKPGQELIILKTASI